MDRVTAPRPAAPRRRGGAARAFLLPAVISLGGCALNQQGVTPPSDTFFFPASATTDPTGQWLFVTNSNADLRFNDGTLVVLDAAAAAADRAPSKATTFSTCPREDYLNPLPRSDAPICCWDLLDPNILDCDERRYVQADATVRIGSFAAGILWQDQTALEKCAANQIAPSFLGRLLIGVRGDTSLTWVDVNQGSPHPTFDCADSTGRLVACDSAHRLVDTTSALGSAQSDPNPPAVNLPDEPYALALDTTTKLLYVGHLVGSTSVPDTGGVSLFDVSGAANPSMPTTSSSGGANPDHVPPPRFVAPFASPFPPNGAGTYGITSLLLHPPLAGGSSNEVFATSRYVPQVASLVPLLFSNDTCSRFNTDIAVVTAGDSLNTTLAGSETRGVTFLDAYRRAYVLQRLPPALVGFDIVTNESGGTSAVPTDVNETCSSPTFLYQHQVSPAEGPRLYVNCFDTGEIYVFDPIVSTLLTTFQVGRGPAGMVFPSVAGDDSPIAYVINFSDNDISVVDLLPGSPTQYHVVERLGFPTTMPR